MALGMGVTEMEAARPSAETRRRQWKQSTAHHKGEEDDRGGKRAALAVGITVCASVLLSQTYAHMAQQTALSQALTKVLAGELQFTRLDFMGIATVESIGVIACTARWTTHHGRSDGFAARPTHWWWGNRRRLRSRRRRHRTDNGSDGCRCLNLIRNRLCLRLECRQRLTGHRHR